MCGQELVPQGGTGAPVCRGCWQSLRPWTGPVCNCCGVPFASLRAAEFATPTCSDCQREAPAFDLARSYGLYNGSLRALILQLKFRRRERLGKRLGGLLQPLWESLELQDALLVPVPLHSSRQRERGFNQAELLTRGLARSLRPSRRAGQEPRVETRCLRRTRPTPPQTGLSPTARRENVRGVFAVDRPERVRDRPVALIDDVMTTGATLAASAAALKQAGARRVYALTLARATPQFPDLEPGMPLIPVDEFSRKQT